MFLATLPTVRASCPEYLPYRASPWRWRGTVAAHHERDLSRFHPPEHDGLWLCRPCRPAAGPSASPTRRRGADHGAVDRYDRRGLVAHPGGDGSRMDLAALHGRPLWRGTRPWRVGLGSLVVASVLLWSQATTASCEPVACTPPITDQPRRPRWAVWGAAPACRGRPLWGFLPEATNMCCGTYLGRRAKTRWWHPR